MKLVKRFHRLCHVQLDISNICKVNSTNWDCIRKTMVGWQCKPQRKGDNFYVLLGTVKDFIGYLFSLYFCCFTYFVSIEIGKGISVSQSILKFMRLTLNYIITVISAFTHSCDTNTFTYNITRIHLMQLKIHNI